MRNRLISLSYVLLEFDRTLFYFLNDSHKIVSIVTINDRENTQRANYDLIMLIYFDAFFDNGLFMFFLKKFFFITTNILNVL